MPDTVHDADTSKIPPVNVRREIATIEANCPGWSAHRNATTVGFAALHSEGWLRVEGGSADDVIAKVRRVAVREAPWT